MVPLPHFTDEERDLARPASGHRVLQELRLEFILLTRMLVLTPECQPTGKGVRILPMVLLCFVVSSELGLHCFLHISYSFIHQKFLSIYNFLWESSNSLFLGIFPLGQRCTLPYRARAHDYNPPGVTNIEKNIPQTEILNLKIL